MVYLASKQNLSNLLSSVHTTLLNLKKHRLQIIKPAANHKHTSIVGVHVNSCVLGAHKRFHQVCMRSKAGIALVMNQIPVKKPKLAHEQALLGACPLNGAFFCLYSQP